MPYLLVLLGIALLVYCLIDVLQSDRSRVRALPRIAWLALVVLVPFVGPIAWLVAGRPLRLGGARPAPQSAPRPRYRRVRPSGPDDDPEFLAGLSRANARRERERRRRQGHDEGHDDPSSPLTP